MKLFDGAVPTDVPPVTTLLQEIVKSTPETVYGLLVFSHSLGGAAVVVVDVRSVVVSAVLASVVVDVISVVDSEEVVDSFIVVSSVLDDVLGLADSEEVSKEVSEVEPKVSEVVSVGPSDVTVSKLVTSCSVDEDASVLKSLEKIDDWVVTEDSTSSEEAMVDVTTPNVCVRVEADVSTIWEETVMGASELMAEADELIVWEETVENTPVPGSEETVDDTEPNICEEVKVDVLMVWEEAVGTIWEETVVNASEPDGSEKVLLGSAELRELNSVDTVVSAVVGFPLLTPPELTASGVVASGVVGSGVVASGVVASGVVTSGVVTSGIVASDVVGSSVVSSDVTGKAEVEVSKPTS